MNRVLTTAGSIFPQDLYAIQVFQDGLVLMFPDSVHYLNGIGMHRAAPMIAAGCPLPTTSGALFADFFPPDACPMLETCETDRAVRELVRPMCLSPQSEWVLFDTNQRSEPKWLVRLCDLRRITLSKRGRVCFVFNDFVFAVEPRSPDSPRELFNRIDSDFPKSRSQVSKIDEVNIVSVWASEDGFLLPFPTIAVARIEKLDHEDELSNVDQLSGDPGPLCPNRVTYSESQRPDDPSI